MTSLYEIRCFAYYVVCNVQHAITCNSQLSYIPVKSACVCQYAIRKPKNERVNITAKKKCKLGVHKLFISITLLSSLLCLLLFDDCNNCCVCQPIDSNIIDDINDTIYINALIHHIVLLLPISIQQTHL